MRFSSFRCFHLFAGSNPSQTKTWIWRGERKRKDRIGCTHLHQLPSLFTESLPEDAEQLREGKAAREETPTENAKDYPGFCPSSGAECPRPLPFRGVTLVADQGPRPSRIPFCQACPVGENSLVVPCFIEGHSLPMPQRRLCTHKCCYKPCISWPQPNCSCGECLRRGHPFRPVDKNELLVNLLRRYEGDRNHLNSCHGGFPWPPFCVPRVGVVHEGPLITETEPSRCKMEHGENVCTPLENKTHFKHATEHDVGCKDHKSLDRKPCVQETKPVFVPETRPSEEIKLEFEEPRCATSTNESESGQGEATEKGNTPERESTPSAILHSEGGEASQEITRSSSAGTTKKKRKQSGKAVSARANSKTSRTKKPYSKEHKRHSSRAANPRGRNQKSDHIVSSKGERKRDSNGKQNATGGKRQRNKLNRILANENERRRVSQLNNAYQSLRKVIPGYHCDTKLPKIKILRYAIRYIAHLDEVLQGSDTVWSVLAGPGGFTGCLRGGGRLTQL